MKVTKMKNIRFVTATLTWNSNNTLSFCLFDSNVHCPLFCFVKFYVKCSINMSGIRDPNLNHPVTYKVSKVYLHNRIKSKKKQRIVWNGEQLIELWIKISDCWSFEVHSHNHQYRPICISCDETFWLLLLSKL